MSGIIIKSEEYLERFDKIQKTESFKATKLLVAKGKRVRNIFKKHTLPTGEQCDFIKEFILEIEEWKYGMEADNCNPYYQRHVAKNCAASIVIALTKVHISIARNEPDVVVLSHLNYLKGMGSVKEGANTSSARQKMASSVLRLIYPEKYGVVDWRVAAVVNAEKGSRKKLREKYDVINAELSSEMFELYRQESEAVYRETGKNILPGDIESVLFYLSLELYPPKNA
ncbi:hypothetical protein [Rheinheimera oceanensis]|uniref:hypothetical protein n=1 Tax=Rheinheimera oceanensis TaxID=2817449 RepID=UPI001BFECF03|nr:hypothetical protein [Rheinheimera oceanensis]